MGDVYNPGGRNMIPRLYTIESPFEEDLGNLREHDAFRLFGQDYQVHAHEGNGFTMVKSKHESDIFALPGMTYVLDHSTDTKKTLIELIAGDPFEPVDTFEILVKQAGTSIVRSSGGYCVTMSNKIQILRGSDLARAPNGYSESKVALASFPVAHVVSHRTLRINRVQTRGGEDGYMTAFVGDAQASVCGKLLFFKILCRDLTTPSNVASFLPTTSFLSSKFCQPHFMRYR
jgi:hypothetical protein